MAHFVYRNAAVRRANGAFENSPQFQLRVPMSKMKFVPAGRLKIFIRPDGALSVGNYRPAVETAGYFRLSLRDISMHQMSLRKKLDRILDSEYSFNYEL
ncbi:MAG: hypothetical protein ABUL66_01025 [Verrucomicrobiota bacterium]